MLLLSGARPSMAFAYSRSASYWAAVMFLGTTTFTVTY